MQARHRWYRTMAPHRGVRRRTEADVVYGLDSWLEAAAAPGSPTRIVVLAAGPSANTYEHRDGDLIVATNSSQELARAHPYVYFLSEGFHVDRFTKLGPASSSCRGVFFRVATADRPTVQSDVANRVLGYGRRYVRTVPEVFASDLEPTGIERETFDQFEAAILDLLGLPIRQYNSGFGATYLGYFLAARLDASLCLYGLDAGVSGHAHFDGTSMQSPSVVGDRVRTKLGELLDLLAEQDHVDVVNRSAFRPTAEQRDDA